MSENRIKSGKLIVATLAILVCLASITGATLALFTSDPNDGKIGINATAGNLEVNIVDTSKDENTLVGDTLDFYTTPERPTIYFEPGAVYRTEGFKVKNEGNIPIDYIIYITEDTSQLDVNFFYEAFEVGITTDPITMRDLQPMREFRGDNLAAKHSSETYYLVFKMKTSANDDYQDKEFSGIGITVCAIQGNIYGD